MVPRPNDFAAHRHPVDADRFEVFELHDATVSHDWVAYPRVALKGKHSVRPQRWPRWSEADTLKKETIMAIQVNGKIHARITVAADSSDEVLNCRVLADRTVTRHVDDSMQRIIVVPKKLVGNVVRWE